MKDRELLIWIYARLLHKDGESELIDYMQKLRCIIKDMDKNKETVNTGQGKNSIEEMLKDE